MSRATDATLRVVRARSRVLVAVVIAFALHAFVREVVDAMQLRVRPVLAANDDVVITLDLDVPRRVVHTPAPVSMSAAMPRVRQERRELRVHEPSAGAQPQPIIGDATDVAAVDDAPDAPRAVVAPLKSSDDLGPRLRQPKPRSFLERVIAGTSGVPPPNLDGLLRAPPAETEGQAARRKVQALASAAAARGGPPPADAGTTIDSLEKLDDGSYRYETGGFIATIHVDGRVTFVNKDNNGGLASSALPGRDPNDIMQPYGPPIDPIARIDLSPTPRVGGVPIAEQSTTLGSGSFDPTAAMLRAQGQDPYEHEKLCFLDETVALRSELRVEHEKRQMAGLRRALERAWFDDAHTPEERRAALFAMWDECREEEVGLLARELVESFVRQHLPKGSPEAFGDDELAALNARRTSVMEFRPYG